MIAKGYKQTEVGIIPEDWICDKVENIFEIHNNKRLPLSEDVRKEMSGIYPYYGPTKIQDYINEYRLEGTYALIGEDGDHFLKWKFMDMTQLVTGKFNVNNHAHIIKGSKKVITEWFFYFFQNLDITQNLTRQGAGRYKLTKASLGQLRCAVPPTLNEQEAIAKVLTGTDNLIQALEKVIAKKKAIKKGAMQQLLTPPNKGGKRLPGFSGEWVEKSLGELGSIITGSTPSTYNKGFWEGDIPWITPTDIGKNKDIYTSERRISIAGVNVIRKLPKDTLLVTCIASIGKNTILRKEGACNQQINAIVPNQNNNVDFLYYLIENNNSLILSKAGKTATLMVSKQVFSEITLYVSIEIKEQEAIANVLSDMDKEIEALEVKKEKYIQLKKGLAQELLTGKTRLV